MCCAVPALCALQDHRQQTTTAKYVLRLNQHRKQQRTSSTCWLLTRMQI
jgi:hypothetical protein